jgi:putative GTP pyrophosphokinase
MKNDINELKAEYDSKHDLYDNFCDELKSQLIELLRQNNISIAVPVETRTKSWESILEKFNNKKISFEKLSDIADLAGLRVILLFKRDQMRVCELIKRHFNVISIEDTIERLESDKFGYGSVHFNVSPKSDWLAVPTMKLFDGLQAEVQVRTASQHIWAAVSHLLQYKRENNIPRSVSRSVNRVAALLELVDLEFERVLTERESYVSQPILEDEVLNTDILKKILFEYFPKDNADESDDIAGLLNDLTFFKILTVSSIRKLIQKHLNAALKREEEAVKAIKVQKQNSRYFYREERIKKGVFFTHVGLARQVLHQEFKEAFKEYQASQNKKKAVK